MSEPKTMKINNVEYVRADSVPEIKLPEGDFSPWEIGESYFIKTATDYYLGILVLVTDQELVFSKVSWVAHTGRYNQFLSGSEPQENEPYPDGSLAIVGRGALISAVKREVYIEVI